MRRGYALVLVHFSTFSVAAVAELFKSLSVLLFPPLVASCCSCSGMLPLVLHSDELHPVAPLRAPKNLVFGKIRSSSTSSAKPKYVCALLS